MVSTIKDIAKMSGVSTATVSRVINQMGGYSKEVEKKVLAVAEKLDYHKNGNATSLVKNTTHTLGIIMPALSTSFYREIVNGIEGEAYSKHYSVILTHAGPDGHRLKESLKLMAERRVDGIIVFSVYLSPSDIETIERLNIPILLISTKVKHSKIPFIKVDDYLASYTAVEYLIKKGHRQIGMAGVNPDDPIAGAPRIKGYKDALEDNELRISEHYIRRGGYSFDSGKEAMEYFLANKTSITAVFCVSDETAMGVISACYENDVKVPDNISVVGYDNSTISSMASPSITTIAQPFYEMGQTGCKELIESILNKEPIQSKVVPFELIERKSVRTII